MSISTVKDKTNTPDIRAFIRLGNGYPSPNKEEKPILLQPLFIEYRLASREYEVELSQDGKYLVKDLVLQYDYLKPNDPTLSVHKSCFDKELRSRYMSYINEASIINSEVLKTNMHTYALILYYCRAHSYLAIASADGSGNIFVQAFVGLGEGTPIDSIGSGVLVNELEPSVLTLN